MAGRRPYAGGYSQDELDAAETDSPVNESSAPCTVCGQQTVLCCSGCENIFYCSDECQQRDWRNHRRVCSRQIAQGNQSNQDSERTLGSPALPSSPQGDRGDPGSRRLGGGGSPAQDYANQTPGDLFAAREAMTTTRDRRTQLRASAVLAAREQRHKDALGFAAEAFEVAQYIKSGAGAIHTGFSAAEEAASLAEVIIVCRSAVVEGNTSVGLNFLHKLLEITDRLAGTGSAVGLFEPCAAATLLCSVAELCYLYEHRDNAEDYGHAFLAMARVAHGEGSPAVGDAHGLLMGMLVKWGRHGEALLHANMLLQIRQRHSSSAATDKLVADANWNIGVLKFQVGQYDGAFESLRDARDIHSRVAGEGWKSADIDVALGTLHRIRGDYKQAVHSFHAATRARQRAFGFAHPETRKAAALLDATEVELKGDIDLGVDRSQAGGDPKFF